ncbi:MAG TPA: PAS domain S-box protein [Candidatus Baltobacteraceae bacterium]|nr:PAS domain S-box protein [Candidatus Baltobacteraceae bacterium]
MKRPSRIFARRYAATLQNFLANRGEASLERAYKLGREAVAAKVGLLNIVRIYQDALEKLIQPASSIKTRQKIRKAAETFFLESLSPFEATQRGFSQMTDWLRQRNEQLEKEIAVREQAERAAQTSEARLRAILDHSPAVVFLKDMRGRYLHVNRQFERRFGFSERQVIGKTDQELFSRKQSALFLANDRKVLREGSPLEFEETARYRDGIHTSIVSKFPLVGPKGKIYALCGIATDITARKRAEEDLRQSEERFRLLISSVKDYAIYMLSPSGNISSWNTGAERIKGWRENEIIGKSYAQFYTLEDARRGQPRRELEIALRQGRFEGEGWRVRKDSSRFWANVIVTPVRGHAGKLLGFAKVTRDMTEQRLTQEAWRQLSKKILDAQEEERKRISRELHDETGQALTAISVMLAALKHDDSVAKSKYAERKLAETQKLLEKTMESIHHFARELRPSMLDELGLIPALRSHVKNFSERTGLHVRLSANPIAEQLNGEQKTVLFRIAQESLTNVAKHAHANRVSLTVRKAGEHLLMEIADNGKSFQVNPKDAAKRKQRLGLLGMQERVRLVNGRFIIKPQPGKGTTVQVTIPFQNGSPMKTVKRRFIYGKNSSAVS